MASQPPNRPACAQPTSGFPSPAADSAEARLDVRDLLVKRPAATFYLRMRGARQAAIGLYTGDVLVVDRSLTPTPGRLVVVATEGELRVTRWSPQPDHAASATDDCTDGCLDGAELWGVVTYVIHQADVLGGDATADVVADVVAGVVADVAADALDSE